jgi:hypothetical protein
MSEPCPVCVEPFNRSKRIETECAYCQYKVCRECVETYILQQHSPKCMNCTKEWTRDMLVRHFSKKFINTKYKTHRENCLFEQEKAMLPATQPVVEQIIADEQIKTQIIQTRIHIQQLYEQIRVYEDMLNSNRRISRERKSFIRKCPNSECRGFLSTQWKCNLCNFKTCKECNECMRNEDEHKCDPNNVETAKLIAKDSKSCPNCGEMIFKTEGCDQMFCTQCHTAFSWRTGRVEAGMVHNPHYFEWLQQRNQRDNQLHNEVAPQCGREIDHYLVRQMCRDRQVVYSPRMIELCRNVIHLREVVLRQFETNRFNDNQDLRVLFLRNRITEDYFRTTLQKREKARVKKQDIYRLLAMVIQCVTEIIYRYIEEKHAVDEYLSEIANLLEYANTCLKNISKNFSSRQYYLGRDLELHRA